MQRPHRSSASPKPRGTLPPTPVYLTLAFSAAGRAIVSFALFRANALISIQFDTMTICGKRADVHV